MRRTPEGREWRLLRTGLVTADLAMYACALIVAAHVSEHLWPGGWRSSDDLLFTLPLLPVVPLTFASQGLYDRDNLLGGTREYASVVRSCTYILVGTIMVSFATRVELSREWLVVSWLLACALVGTARFGVRRIVYRLRRRGLFMRRVLLLGVDAQGVAIARRLTRPVGGFQVVGVLDDYLPVGAVLAGGFKVLGTSSRLSQVATWTKAGEVIVIPQALPWESLQRLMTAGTAPDGLRIHLLGGFYDLLTTGVQLSRPSGVPMLTIRRVVLSTSEAALKRALDLILAGGLLLLLAPVVALDLGYLLVRGGPLIERTPVFGRDMQQFDLLTLPSHTLTGSAMVRKLPSLVNVLRGRLTIVGPHPMRASADAQRSESHVTTIRPGLTGLWRQSEDPAEQILLDLYYVRGYSMWFDLQILFDRVRVRLRPRMRRERTELLDGEPARLVPPFARGDDVLGQAPVPVGEDRGVMQ